LPTTLPRPGGKLVREALEEDQVERQRLDRVRGTIRSGRERVALGCLREDCLIELEDCSIVIDGQRVGVRASGAPLHVSRLVMANWPALVLRAIDSLRSRQW
jgi:hypothetical protein